MMTCDHCGTADKTVKNTATIKQVGGPFAEQGNMCGNCFDALVTKSCQRVYEKWKAEDAAEATATAARPAKQESKAAEAKLPKPAASRTQLKLGGG